MHRIFFTLKLYYFLRNDLLFVHSIRNPICLLCERIAIVDKDGNFTELPERESPLLQMWDESEVKSSVSSDTLMI